MLGWMIFQLILVTFSIARSIIFLLCCLVNVSAPEGSQNSITADLFSVLTAISLTGPQLEDMEDSLSAFILEGRF